MHPDHGPIAQEFQRVNAAIGIEINTEILCAAQLRHDAALDFAQRHELSLAPRFERLGLIAAALRGDCGLGDDGRCDQAQSEGGNHLHRDVA